MKTQLKIEFLSILTSNKVENQYLSSLKFVADRMFRGLFVNLNVYLVISFRSQKGFINLSKLYLNDSSLKGQTKPIVQYIMCIFFVKLNPEYFICVIHI